MVVVSLVPPVSVVVALALPLWCGALAVAYLPLDYTAFLNVARWCVYRPFCFRVGFAQSYACEIPVSPEFLERACGTVFTSLVTPEEVLLPFQTNQI